MSGASSKNLRFSIPLPLATALWSHKNPWVRQQSLRLLRHFEESWKSSDSPAYDYSEERHDKERLAFAQAIAWHINRSEQPSELLTSKRGQEFIRFIHNEIIVRRLYSQYGFYERMWRNAISKVREVGKLPLDYFMDLPYPNKDPPPSTEPPRLVPIRYSIDTVRADEESPPLAVVESIDIQVQVCGSRGNATSEIANLADNVLVSSSAKRGSWIQGYTLPLESVAEGTNVAPLSAGEDEQNGAVPQDTGQDRPMSTQAIVGVAPAFSTTPHISDTTVAGSTPSGTEHISSESQVFESTGERVPDNEEGGLGSVHTVRTSASGYQANHAEELQDEGRVGWNPTNDPNLLRVYWLRP
ncbi:hypothetical protein VNI00_018571 [Paramarasmius palmivorus]|uniref:Uncharacterized protein n=1 Tax=Paramarasmius palmivorus TaxID=297713 RepID=A0AAW0AXT8_9AGAR